MDSIQKKTAILNLGEDLSYYSFLFDGNVMDVKAKL